jgi:hypothetical protein
MAIGMFVAEVLSKTVIRSLSSLDIMANLSTREMPFANLIGSCRCHFRQSGLVMKCRASQFVLSLPLNDCFQMKN